MEFASREEMLAYEKAREAYYMKFIKAGVCELYALWFKEIFIPKYRKLKKKYDSYFGGWYRNEKGFIHSNHIIFVDLDRVSDGDICITDYEEYYILKNGVWHQVIV